MRMKNNGFPPGGIQFQDPRVTTMKWLDGHTDLGERIKEVVRFRKANPRIYDPVKDSAALDMVSVGNEIVTYNCARIGNDPNWCYDETKPAASLNVAAPAVPAENRTCPKCGCQLIAVYCKTCGGNKINSWDCPACKKSY